LAKLEVAYQSEKAGLFILYGRRRVGKTELLRKFCVGKSHLFFIASLSCDAEQLANFSRLIWGFTHDQVPEGFTFPSWESALQTLADLPGRPIIVLDEFTYLMSGNKAISSIVQKVWDQRLASSQVLLVLCGSYIGMMEAEVFGYKAPLYGRRTGSLLLQSLDLIDVSAFFKKYSPIQQLEAWAILGGMPYYLSLFQDREDLYSNIRRQILDPRGALHQEPRLLLMEELREPRNYFSILRAIAEGGTRLNEIAQGAGLGAPHATARYLDLLQQMRYVERLVPASESRPERSKKGVYRITDPFLRFWFRYVHPHSGSLTLGLADAVLEQRIRPTFDGFVAEAFEQAARDYLARLAKRGQLPFLPERIGGWWDRDAEIDVVAISDSEKSVLLGECKWSSHPVGINILEELKQKAESFSQATGISKLSYALFSKSGFTPALRKVANKEKVLLTIPRDLFAG
jgi:uncharacterized protein